MNVLALFIIGYGLGILCYEISEWYKWREIRRKNREWFERNGWKP